MPTSEPLIDRLDEVWSDIIELCNDLASDQWNTATECPGWSVRDNVAHMIGTERMLMGDQPSAGSEIADEPYVRNDIGKMNQRWIASYLGLTGSELLDEFAMVTQQRLAALRKLTPEDWDREGFTPEGRGPYRQFMAIRVFDCWYHDQDIREALDRPGLMEGAVADLSLQRIVDKGLGYIVGKKAAAPANSTVVFEVVGAPPIIATIAVPPEGRATLVDDTPAAPTTRITTDRRTFARLAGGRWSGDHARTAGAVRIERDQALGNRIIDNMSFTI